MDIEFKQITDLPACYEALEKESLSQGTRVFSWNNNLTTADYNADITATAEGTYNMVVLDADGNTVLNRSLDGAVEPDSFSGVTDAGTSGIWSVTITVNSFNGDGSFSLSEAN